MILLAMGPHLAPISKLLGIHTVKVIHFTLIGP